MEWPLAWRRRRALERMLDEEKRASQVRAAEIVESLERDGAGTGRIMAALARELDQRARAWLTSRRG